MNLVNLLVAILLTFLLFIIFRWAVGYLATEFGADMPGSVVAAIAAILAIAFGWYGYTRGPSLWTRP